MNDDKTVLAPVEVPGMQINFQSPVGPSGKIIAFVCSAEADITSHDLNRRLDVIAAAARRQDAFEQLRLDENNLGAGLRLLPKLQAEREALEAARTELLRKMDATLRVVVPNRRNRVEHAQATPQDISMLATYERDIKKKDEDILACQGGIAGSEERIPFWQAILRGEEPLDLGEPPRMAAE